MRTVKPEVLHYMMRALKKYETLGTLDIPVWRVTESRYLGGGQYEECGKAPRGMKLGERWETGYDSAVFFSAETAVPPGFAGKKLYLELDFGGEALVRVNGIIAGGVSSAENAGWVHRDRILLGDLDAGTTLAIEAEATVNSGGFCDAAMDGAESTVYTLSKARLVCIDEVCEGYIIDTATVWDALGCIADEYIKTRVFAALDDSMHMVDFDFEDSRVRASIADAADVLKRRLDEIRYTPSCEVLMTGHSHIDIAWLWRVQESERKAARTFANNLALMDRYPDFVFAQSQAVLYDMTQRLYPELFGRVKEKVQSGQWDIVGNVWVEADTNIASGESLIRQLLYGREFFKREFGAVSDIYWLPDCFGFSWALPQIIRRSGMKYFLTAKLNGQDTNRFPHTVFRWIGNDGSEVLAYLQRTGYGGEYEPGAIAAAANRNDEKDTARTVMGMFGYGDGGGGCTYAMVERGRRLQNFPGLPGSRIGHAQEFFETCETVRGGLPAYRDEMYYENHRGTYTSQAFVKKGNRKGEFLLAGAEAAATAASCFAGAAYPQEPLDGVWKLLLKNQFHDILPGTSIHEAFEDCRADYETITQTGTRLFQTALGSLNARIESRADGVVVWSFLPHKASGPAEIEIDAMGADTAAFDRGEQLRGAMFERDGKAYLRFLAADVPAMGYKTFSIAPRQRDFEPVRATARLLENEFLRAEFDENGILTSVFDKENAREVLAGRGNLLTVFQDKCVHETAWNLELNYQKKYWELLEAESVEVPESNEVRGVIRIVRAFGQSRITQDIILTAGERRLDFETTADWQESDKILKAAFEVGVLNTRAWFETAHGAIDRPTHWSNGFDLARFEQCAHKWADLSEGGYGVSLLNDCKYGYDIKDHVMRLSLLRAPTCPDRTGDRGMHRFTYSLYPHQGGWQDASTVQKAFELNVPFAAFPLTKQDGTLPPQMALVEADCPNVVVEAVKQALDGNGIILRFYEAGQRRGTVTVKTTLPFTKVLECNLMEVDEREIPSSGDTFAFDYKPFEVRTFRLIP